MIGHQLRSAHHLFAFHRWRLSALAARGATPPCAVELDDETRSLIRTEIANTQAALPLVEADPRLGYHQEAHGHLYDPGRLRAKLDIMRVELEGSASLAESGRR